MKGDFSQWYFDPKDNFAGVLHQQGKVLLDSDWNAQTRILNDWQDTAAQDIIGSGIAAVPADTPDAFQVTQAQVTTVDGKDRVELTLFPGRIWADGLLVYLDGDKDNTGKPIVLGGKAIAKRIATYLDPPIQTPPTTPIGDTIRDAVILEVWREAINGFQIPSKLIEPALGGPDTTERIHTAMALRLFRLAEGETCDRIRNQLQDNFENKGKLTASLQPPVVLQKDCPVVEGGGYTGFEHQLYRIEIAQVKSSDPPMFKWSQFNGGLVGRGKFDATNRKVEITANLPAIESSGLSEFYLEAIEYDAALGYWNVTYGAKVTLDGNQLELPTTAIFDTIRASNNSVFFRLWNDIRRISDFPISATPTALQDGIRLEFEAPGSGKYTPGDYWTFTVRAGEIGNHSPLIDAQPPEGIHYHRVPLAELHWDADRDITKEQIEDCRHPFQPLTNQKGCCSFSVGDGVRSKGDFNSIEEAIWHLPPEGGKVCVLPGRHSANVVICDRQNIQITGCGMHTIVHPHSDPDRAIAPIFRIETSQEIQLEQMTLMTNAGTAIQVIDSEKEEPIEEGAQASLKQASRAIYILWNRIVACIHAIEIRVLETASDNDIWIAYNQIGMLDKPEGRAAIFSIADDVLIERNQLVVISPLNPDNPNDPRPPDPPIDVSDPCQEAGFYYTAKFPAYRFLQATFLYMAYAFAAPRIVYRAEGGIQIGGGSEKVRILNNEIVGGRGNGITLGHLPIEILDDSISLIISELPGDTLEKLQATFVGFLYTITIADNTIHRMGLSGIGVVAFLHTERLGLVVKVEDLTVYRNIITKCAHQLPDDIPATMLYEVGFGGIALTACENAIIQENRIEENGISHINPICGIFILLGEKVDISNNRILKNGLRNSASNDNVKPGLRGGIVIRMSFKPLQNQTFASQELLFPDGIPAAKIYGNIVTQPLGQALFIMALGPVSVIDNQFTSQDADFRVNPLSLLAGAVFILNLGLSKDLVAYILLASFRNLASANLASVSSSSAVNTDPLLRILYLPNGNVLFANNQTTLDLRSQQINFAFSSQLIASLDDVAYNNNQAEYTSLIDFIWVFRI